MDQLSEARQIINRVDEQMAVLFCQRMEAAKTIAAYKQQHGLPIRDAAREKAVLEHSAARLDDAEIKAYYLAFLENLMALSRRYQGRLTEGSAVAYCGVEGAFADIAARRIFPDGRQVGFADFQSAYRAVSEGRCDCAVLPMENSYAGVVGQVMDLLFEGDLYVNGLYNLPVTQNLLAVQGAALSQIKTVISHPQALSQCADYLQAHGFQTQSAANTAVAAKQVAAAGDPTVAAIASAETAALYGLEVLDHDLNASAANTTRFAVFSRAENRPAEGKEGRFILLFTVNDVAGALAKAINVISDHGFNMKALRSRPVKKQAWQYYFYVEAEGSETSQRGQEMLAALRQVCETLKIAGHFTNEIDLKEGEPV